MTPSGSAHHLHHLHPDQPVSRDPRGGPALQANLKSLENVHVPSSAGGQVPLSAIATITERTAPLQIAHLSQFPAVTVSFNLAPGVALGEAVEIVKEVERGIGLPASITTAFRARRWPSRGRCQTSSC